MAISLVKGQKIDLTKGNPTLSKITIGLGWDPIEQSKGFLSSILGRGNNDNFDCDASVIMLNEIEKLEGMKDVIYFGNLKSKDGSVNHTGDNLTGDGDGDDEQIIVDLSKVSQNIKKLVFVVNIYDAIKRKQHFGQLANAYIRIVNNSDGKEIFQYSLTENYEGKTSLIFGELYRHNNEWKFTAIGEPTNDPGLSEVLKRYA
ncbi:MAG: TerD family protein [Fusobacteriaceae bacterium]